jgi:N-acetylglucosaminyl-diphospho-decaprenol L-rhamnosyltransferase
MIAPLPMSVVIVSFNTRELLGRCLSSVLAADPVKTVVVDNGSTDGSSELVRETFSSCDLLTTERNQGYGAAANTGIAACSTEGVLLLNGDTVVAPDALMALGGYLANRPQVAVAGPRLVNPDGSVQRSTYGYPSALDILVGEAGLHLLVQRVPILRERFYRTWNHATARRVPWVLGAALAIRQSAFVAVGGFDPAYFMYGEEVDLCWRLDGLGFETHYAPVTTVIHLGGASTGNCSHAMRRELIISRMRYLRSHGPPETAVWRVAALRTIVGVQLIRDAILYLVSRNRDRRTRLRGAIGSWHTLLLDRELWRQ